MVDNIPVMAHHLSFDQIETFNEDGFLAVESLLDDDDLVPLEQGVHVINPLANVPMRYTLESSSRVRPVAAIRWSVKTLTPIVCPGMLIAIPSVETPTMTQP